MDLAGCHCWPDNVNAGSNVFTTLIVMFKSTVSLEQSLLWCHLLNSCHTVNDNHLGSLYYKYSFYLSRSSVTENNKI